jgi:hypothetical protein
MAVDNSNQPDSIAEKKAGSEGVDSPAGGKTGDSKRSPHNTKAGGKALNTEKAKYADSKSVTVENGTGPKALETLKQKYVPNSDLPTTASAPPGKDLAQIIAKVDPLGKAQVFAGMVKQFAMIKMLMTLAGGSAGGAPMGQSQTNTLIDAFSEALCILCNRTSYLQVITALNYALAGGSISRISTDYQAIVQGGVSKLVEKALIFGENNIPLKPTPPVIFLDTTYENVTFIDGEYYLPDLTTKNYYALGQDPYLGYAHYTPPTGEVYLIKRTLTDYPYETAELECLALAEKGIADDMYPYIIPNLITGLPTLTAEILDDILQDHKVRHENNGMERVVGKNSSTNLMALLPSLLGAVGTLTNLASTSYLGSAVLGSSAATSLNNFAKNAAMTSVMASMASSALKLPLPIAGLGGLAAMAGSLGGLGISIPGALSSLGGATNLLNSINTFGAVSALTSVLASNADISDKLLSAGISLSALALASQGTPVASSRITKAMAIGGASALAVGATAKLIDNIGV